MFMRNSSVVLLLLFCIPFSTVKAQQGYQPSKENLAAREWFKNAKFGMFIHWGASSVLADGEWVMNNRNIKVNQYFKLQNIFNPQKFDAVKWVGMAKAAGMKYITFVSRHHDSFSNWDTKQSDWKITNTPYGKDVLKALAEECKKQDLKLFLYYSTLDWSRNDYHYKTGRTGQGTGRTEQGDWNQYIAFMKAQLTELLTNYGEIGGIWFDGHWDQTEPEGAMDRSSRVDWHYDEIYSLIHKLQPQTLIGNNHHLTPLPGEDFQMFERDLPGENKSGLSFQKASENLPLETCQTINESWGFNITDDKYKSSKQIVRLLVNASGLNANLLLNIGPLPDGTIQPEFSTRLDSVGQWMAKYGKSVYGTHKSSLGPKPWGTITEKDDQIFLHVYDEAAKTIVLNGLSDKPRKLISLSTGKPVKYKYRKGQLVIHMTNIDRDNYDTVLNLTVSRN